MGGNDPIGRWTLTAGQRFPKPLKLGSLKDVRIENDEAQVDTGLQNDSPHIVLRRKNPFRIYVGIFQNRWNGFCVSVVVVANRYVESVCNQTENRLQIELP